jgi:hypothetical protein
MKLLVDVETFMGSRIAMSIASTLNKPLPIPRSPENTPAMYIITPAGITPQGPPRPPRSCR